VLKCIVRKFVNCGSTGSARNDEGSRLIQKFELVIVAQLHDTQRVYYNTRT